MSVEVVLNGEPRRLASPTLAAALEAAGIERTGRGVAVAVDGEVVPRGSWDTCELVEGQRVEVLHAVQGGSG